MARILWRTLVILHRYLGIAVGFLMLIWFASGIVMMYVGFPRFADEDRIAALSPIPWQSCCRVKDGLIPDDLQFYRIQVENLLGSPAMRLRRPPRPDGIVDLADGVGVREFGIGDAQAIALDLAPRLIGPAGLAAAETIDEDQWTIGRYRSDRPLHRFTFDDEERTMLYVSGTNGKIVLRTTATQRFWNWLGAIPHWFYLPALRSDGALWTQIVIWTSLIGTFLTVLGLYLGIAQFRRGKDGRLSPYRGMFWWHHVAGLVFGVFTLTFVASGLISMNPWGFLEGGGGGGELGRLEGATPRWGEVRVSLAALQERSVDAVSLITAPLAGKLYWLAAAEDGTVTRYDAAGDPAPLTASELAAAAERIAGTNGIAAQGMLNDEDGYYFSHHDEVALPVYRIILNDADQTRYYIDPKSGAPLLRADATARWHRWLFEGLHRLDVAAWLRARPAWDIVMITLLLGGLAGSATGVYLAVRRIWSDVGVLFRMVMGLFTSPRRSRARPTLAPKEGSKSATADFSPRPSP
jgi:hypothetical protein